MIWWVCSWCTNHKFDTGTNERLDKRKWARTKAEQAQTTPNEHKQGQTRANKYDWEWEWVEVKQAWKAVGTSIKNKQPQASTSKHMDKQGWAQAQANNGVCRCMPATTLCLQCHLSGVNKGGHGRGWMTGWTDKGRHGHGQTMVCVGTCLPPHPYSQHCLLRLTPLPTMPISTSSAPLIILILFNFIILVFYTKYKSWVNENQKVAKKKSMVLGMSTWYPVSPTWICAGFSHQVTQIHKLTHSQVFPWVYL